MYSLALIGGEARSSCVGIAVAPVEMSGNQPVNDLAATKCCGASYVPCSASEAAAYAAALTATWYCNSESSIPIDRESEAHDSEIWSGSTLAHSRRAAPTPTA